MTFFRQSIIFNKKLKNIHFVDEKLFIENMLRKFNFENGENTLPTPMNANYATLLKEREKQDEKEKRDLDFPFRQIIGSLLYLQGGTRPDLTYCVNVLSRKQSNYNENDINDLKRVLRYLR